MNVLCKRVHLLDPEPDRDLDCKPDHFAWCKQGIMLLVKQTLLSFSQVMVIINGTQDTSYSYCL